MTLRSGSFPRISGLLVRLHRWSLTQSTMSSDKIFRYRWCHALHMLRESKRAIQPHWCYFWCTWNEGAIAIDPRAARRTNSRALVDYDTQQIPDSALTSSKLPILRPNYWLWIQYNYNSDVTWMDRRLRVRWVYLLYEYMPVAFYRLTVEQ